MFCVRANNPSPMTYTGTNTWVLAEAASPDLRRDRSCSCGRACAERAQCLYRTGAACGCGRVHAHACRSLRKVLKSWRIFQAHACMRPSMARCFLANFARLKTVRRCVWRRCQATRADSAGLAYPADRSMFTGDAASKHGPTGRVHYPDGNLGDSIGFARCARAHRERRGDLRVLSRARLSHHRSVASHRSHASTSARTLAADQRSALATGVARDADALVDAVYVDIDPALREAALRSVQAQLVYLDEEVNSTKHCTKYRSSECTKKGITAFACNPFSSRAKIFWSVPL